MPKEKELHDWLSTSYFLFIKTSNIIYAIHGCIRTDIIILSPNKIIAPPLSLRARGRDRFTTVQKQKMKDRRIPLALTLRYDLPKDALP